MTVWQEYPPDANHGFEVEGALLMVGSESDGDGCAFSAGRCAATPNASKWCTTGFNFVLSFLVSKINAIFKKYIVILIRDSYEIGLEMLMLLHKKRMRWQKDAYACLSIFAGCCMGTLMALRILCWNR